MDIQSSRAKRIGKKIVNMFYTQLSIKPNYNYYRDDVISIIFVDNIEFEIDIYRSNIIRVFIFHKLTDTWVHVDSIEWRHVFTFDELEQQMYYIAQWIIDYFYERLVNATYPYVYILY
ncbi:MAG TPA: hypothetical protein VLG50_07885 [Candidatus Saccharimonadales bacterium]|nr:hypothetical protein [Candidatus Saccharimonadales bacterium]